MSRGDWDQLPYLDVLRPPPGWHTEIALFGTYSLDLYALVATLMALAGVDDERGSGTKIDFANAMSLLKDKVCVLAQRGRLSSPSKAPKVMAILDQYVKEVPMDERSASWHPKIALVKHRSDDGMLSRWCVWLGSRNLSRDVSWDCGISLVSSDQPIGRPVPGIAAIGRELSERAELPSLNPERLFVELDTLTWEAPAGCTVESLEFLEGTGRSMPSEPDGLSEMMVISPFVDGGILRKLGRWGDENTLRRLVTIPSTFGALAEQKMQPLDDFHDHLYMNSPVMDETHLDRDGPLDSPLAEEDEPRGLHAKIILARHKGGCSLWLGSANATQRGWLGPNIEIVAHLSVDSEIANSLEAFTREFCHELTPQLLQSYAQLELDDELEKVRKIIAATWSVIQRASSESHELIAVENPLPSNSQIQLSVRLLGQRHWVSWPRKAASVLLPPVSRGEQTEFIECRLVSADGQLSWVQLTPFDPQLDEDRDSQALSRFLDPRTFLLWIRSLLSGSVLSDGGGEWHEDKAKASANPRVDGPLWDTPTLEEVLKAWSRDPAHFQEIDRKVQYYFRWIAEQTEVDHDVEYLKLLHEFRQVWSLIERELLSQTS
jgi:hypothetical protein